MYRDRVMELDEDTINGWNDTINFLLIFVSSSSLSKFFHRCLLKPIFQAGLFSAVMTAFLIET